jgi:hypothetical protein
VDNFNQPGDCKFVTKWTPEKPEKSICKTNWDIEVEIERMPRLRMKNVGMNTIAGFIMYTSISLTHWTSQTLTRAVTPSTDFE